MPTLLGHHDVKDHDHWLASLKREEFFGPLGVTNIRTFMDPENPKHVAVLMDVADMDAFQAAMQSEGAAEAMEHDGVLPETLVMLAEAYGPAAKRGGATDNVATMRRIYELLSAGDIDGFGDLMAADFVEHEEAPGLEPTKEGVKQLFRMYRAAFPDLRMDVQDLLPSGDKVVGRIRATGTHTGEAFMGVPASGKQVTTQVVDIIRFDGEGLACEHWGLMDVLSMMQQLGAIPAVAPPA